jgi:hypothetical protein
MSPRRTWVGLAIATMGALAILVLDAVGLFLYSGYRVLWMTAVLTLSGFFLRDLQRHGSTRWWRRLSSPPLMGVLLVSLLCLIVPRIPTSGRKAFFLRATALQPGMSTDQARLQMGTYPSFSNDAEHLVFSYRSSAHTVDQTIIELSENGESIRSVRVSLD